MGLRYDRQWAFVDEHGMFVAQRDSRGLGMPVRTMCLIETAIADGTLTLTAPDMPPLHVPADGVDGPDVPVQVWESHTSGVDQGADAGAWATEVLSRERPGRYRLVRMPDRTHRRSKIGDGEVAYGDAYPFLVISEESLADLNARHARTAADEPLPAQHRHRAAARRTSKTRSIASASGPSSSPARRCASAARFPTTDQRTAERGKEPLKTLATYRKQPDGVVFGRNFNHAGTGSVRVGDRVEPPASM